MKYDQTVSACSGCCTVKVCVKVPRSNLIDRLRLFSLGKYSDLPIKKVYQGNNFQLNFSSNHERNDFKLVQVVLDPSWHNWVLYPFCWYNRSFDKRFFYSVEYTITNTSGNTGFTKFTEESMSCRLQNHKFTVKKDWSSSSAIWLTKI